MASEVGSGLQQGGGWLTKPPRQAAAEKTIHHQVTTSTTTVTTTLRDGQITIKRMKEMAEEQHHRNVELQTANAYLTSQLKQAQHQISELKKAFKTERLAYSEMRAKQTRLDKHIEAFNGILQGIDVAHLKLSTNLTNYQAQQEDFKSKLAKSLEDNTSNNVFLKQNLKNYLKLDSKVKSARADILDSRTKNKDLGNELVKCRALISEKAKQLADANAQLKEFRANQVKLEADLSTAKTKYETDMKQKNVDQAVLKEDLSRTVKSLNSYIELRGREHDQKVEAQNLYAAEKAKVSKMAKEVPKLLLDFQKRMEKAHGGHEKDRDRRLAKCDAALASCTQRIGVASSAVLKLRGESEQQQKLLEAKEEMIESIGKQNEELTVNVSSLSSKLDATQSKLMKKTSEADLATKEGKEMQKQLKSLKEEQKQYCIALSNQNASELSKMKDKMKKEIESAKEKLEAQLRDREGEHEDLEKRHGALAESLEASKREAEERGRRHEQEMKEAEGLRAAELEKQGAGYEGRIEKLESALAEAEKKAAKLPKFESDLKAALAAQKDLQLQVEEAARNQPPAKAAGEVAAPDPIPSARPSPERKPAKTQRAPKKTGRGAAAAKTPKTRAPRPAPPRTKKKAKAATPVRPREKASFKDLPSQRKDFADLFEDTLDPYNF